jgi:broad specificity phosphatase PhoE
MRLSECVWILRHAETATPHVFHGAESDEVLSRLGERQAEALGGWFVAQQPTVVVSSAMRRAVATAAPVARLCGVPHSIEPGFHERRVGDFCGREFGEVEVAWRETVAQWTAGATDFTTPGAESYADLRTRLLDAWQRTVSAHAGARLVVVAHGIVCKVLLLELLADHGPTAWGRIGRVPNVAVSCLTPTPQGYEASPLLSVPETVLRLNDGLPTGLGPVPGRPTV